MRRVGVILLSLLILMTQCDLFRETEQEEIVVPQPRTWSEIMASDTLRVVTIQTCYTAFEYKGKWRGYEYEKAQAVAKSLGLNLEVLLVQSEREMADTLFVGAADLAIWPASKVVFDTAEWLLPVGPKWEAEQVMVSARKLKPIPATDTLTHYKLSLIEGSRQWLAYQDDSVRSNFDFSPFVVDTIGHDSLTSEQLADAMIEGRTDMVMLRSNVALLMKDYYPTLRLSDPLPHSADTVAWVIAQGADSLRLYVDSICAGDTIVPRYPVALKRQFEQQNGKHLSKINFTLSDGALSLYDGIFKKYAKEIGWDWRLLAAIAFIESKLDHTQVSSRGPIGLMQLMPATVRSLGYSEEDVIDPDKNVQAASTLIGNLITTLQKKLPDVSERDLIQFTLAGYNAGLGHVYDAIYLADTLGYDTQVWENNVAHCLTLKSDPNYYSYPKIKLGRFNGAFTNNYISEVLSTYDAFCEKVDRE